ncbi:questin oxidase family protein [Roseomonas sp. F4]
MSDTTLLEAPDALTEARGLSAEYGGAFANHTPMVLWAQRQLGGGEAAARRFLSNYIQELKLGPMAPADGEIRREDWTARLGDRRAEAAYRAFFLAELERLGDARALQRLYLPRLLPGIAASALHALMRLAYATLSEEEAEVATALGYWATTYLPLGEGISAAPITDRPAGVLLEVGAQPALKAMEFDDGLLWHAMRRTAAMPEFAAVHDWLAVGPDTIPKMAKDSLLLFAGTLDFCALHALTGTHWLRLILPVLDPADQQRAIRFFWQAIASVYPKMGCPLPLDEAAAEALRRLPVPDWPEITAAACASDDEHDVSLTYSALCEEAHWGDRLYRVLAARRLGLA